MIHFLYLMDPYFKNNEPLLKGTILPVAVEIL